MSRHDRLLSAWPKFETGTNTVVLSRECSCAPRASLLFFPLSRRRTSLVTHVHDHDGFYQALVGAGASIEKKAANGMAAEAWATPSNSLHPDYDGPAVQRARVASWLRGLRPLHRCHWAIVMHRCCTPWAQRVIGTVLLIDMRLHNLQLHGHPPSTGHQPCTAQSHGRQAHVGELAMQLDNLTLHDTHLGRRAAVVGGGDGNENNPVGGGDGGGCAHVEEQRPPTPMPPEIWIYILTFIRRAELGQPYVADVPRGAVPLAAIAAVVNQSND